MQSGAPGNATETEEAFELLTKVIRPYEKNPTARSSIILEQIEL